MRVENPTASTPTPLTNWRRPKALDPFVGGTFVAIAVSFSFMSRLPHRSGGAPDGTKYGHLRSTAAFEPAQRRPNLTLGRFVDRGEQVGRVHDPAILATSALWGLFVDPGLLYGVKRRRCIGIGALVGGRKALERGDLVPNDAGDRRHARSDRLAIKVHRASSALCQPTSEPGAVELQFAPKHVQKGRIGGHDHLLLLAVHRQSKGLLGLAERLPDGACDGVVFHTTAAPSS